MRIGLIGLARSGKTTIFNALTRSAIPVGSYTDAAADPNQAVIDVPDPRVDELVKRYDPRKTVYALLDLMDFPGLSDPADDHIAIAANTLRLMKNLDAVALVLRNYEDDLLGPPGVIADLDAVFGEFLLSDLMITENRLERIEWSYKRGQKTMELQNEEQILRKIHDRLDNNLPLSTLEMTEIERKIVRGFQFLTGKPMLIILNSDEARFNRDQNLSNELSRRYPLVEFAGKFEMELSQIDDPDEVGLFMEDIGISESARDRLARSAYEILGYISFFTVGSDEVRAWNIFKGSTAVTAAGTIHTDLARGFIRAECFRYDDLIQFGDEAAVRKHGKFRLEGKEYIVQDGDILNIRFNV
ncbi:MAG: DUF933 domain-containing protein [Candidatus Neomarinimicrobiota bacterium]